MHLSVFKRAVCSLVSRPVCQASLSQVVWSRRQHQWAGQFARAATRHAPELARWCYDQFMHAAQQLARRLPWLSGKWGMPQLARAYFLARQVMSCTALMCLS